MYPFKSRKTYERLYSAKADPVELELDSEGIINRRFSEFCQEYAKKELCFKTETKPSIKKSEWPKKTEFQESHAEEQQHKVKFHSKEKKEIEGDLMGKKESMENEKQAENGEEDPLWLLLEEKIKENLKKKDKENPLVRYFKNPLIAAVIESLIVKTIESTFKIKLELDSNEELIPKSMMKLFNISPIALSTMESKQEKLHYVISCMAKNIDDALDRLMQRVEGQEKKAEEFQEKYEEMKTNDANEQRDIFDWLQIRTKYGCLKKRLRISIVEKLNHFENQQIVRSSLRPQKNVPLESSISNPKPKINLLKVPQLSTETILKDMNSDFTLITRRAHYKKGSPPSAPPDPIEANPGTSEPLWNTEQEAIFKTHRKNCKNWYNEEVKCSNFLSIAFLPLIQESYLQEKRTLHRNNKLKQYAEGEWLTQEELKFLADTSSLLNSCVDRRFLQEAINIVDPEAIANIELLLAENIIMNYERLKEVIKKARLVYIKQTNEEKHRKIKEKSEAREKREQMKMKAKENLKFKRTLENICLKMERQGKFFKKPKEKKQLFANMFVKKLKDSLSRRKSLENLKKSQQKPERPEINVFTSLENQERSQRPGTFSSLANPEKKNTLLTETSRKLQMKRRKYHPSSKLFLQEPINDAEDDLEANIQFLQKQKSNRLEIQKFSLNLHSPSYFRSRNDFRRFYSGGPMPPVRSEPFWTPYDPKKPVVCRSQSELNKIVTLQKYFRKHLARMRVHDMRDEPGKLVRDTLKRINKIQKGPGTMFFDMVQTLRLKKSNDKTGSDSNKAGASLGGTNSLGEMKKTKGPTFFAKAIDGEINKTKGIHFGGATTDGEIKKTKGAAIYADIKKTKRTTFGTANIDVDKLNTKGTTINQPKLFTPMLTPIQNSGSVVFFPYKQKTMTQTSSDEKRHLKTGSLLSSMGSKSTLTTQSACFSGLLKHRKLLEISRIGTLNELTLLGFSYTKGDVNVKDEAENTPLFYSAARGMQDLCQFLLKRGANPNEKCSEWDTPLHKAFESGKIEVVMGMLRHGGDLGVRNRQGEQPKQRGNGRVQKELDLKLMVSFL